MNPDRAASRAVSWPAAVLALAAFLPLTPSGESFFDLWRGEMSRGLLPGVMTLIGWGSPFIFGVASALAVRRTSTLAPLWLTAPLAMVHAQLLWVALVVHWGSSRAIASGPLVGFAAVSGLYFVYQSAHAHAVADGPSTRWIVRWGATVIVGVSAWTSLQRFGDIAFGFAVEVVLAAALTMVIVDRLEPRTT